MTDLAAGLGLALVIEGALWGLFPGLAMRLLAAMAASSEETVRLSGFLAAAAGGAVVWLARG